MSSRTAVGWIGALAVGCATAGAPDGWQQRLALASPPPATSNLPLEPDVLERVLARVDFDVRNAEPAGSGVMGALRVTGYYPAVDREITFKWKVSPPDADGWNNTPRKEIAAYQIQKWFLDPEHYVVPVTLANCLPMDVYADIDDEARPNLPDTQCVFGMQAAWLEDVTSAEPVYEKDRFFRDPAYALHLAHYNLLNHLIQNRDTRAANRLASKDPSNRRVYSVDNGITFGETIFNWFRPHWNSIHVPALPELAIERLRRVGAGDYAALMVVAQFRADADGVLRPVEPTAPFDVESGVRWRGDVLQLGLVPEEIEGLQERVRNLVEEVDELEIPVF